MELVPKLIPSLLLALIIGAVAVGAFVVGLWVGQRTTFSTGGFPYTQPNVSAVGNSYTGLLQKTLDKMADVSQNKSAKVTTAKFDVLASIFRLAGSSGNVTFQYEMLCNQTATQDFAQTAMLTNHPNITLAHQTACGVYAVTANDFRIIGPSTFQKLSSDFTDLVFDLMKLDNTISQDP